MKIAPEYLVMILLSFQTTGSLSAQSFQLISPADGEILTVPAEADSAGSLVFTWSTAPAADHYTLQFISGTIGEASFDTLVTDTAVALPYARVRGHINRLHFRSMRGSWTVTASDGATAADGPRNVAFRRIAEPDRFDNAFRTLLTDADAEPDPAQHQTLVDAYLAAYPQGPFVDPLYTDTLDAYASFFYTQDPWLTAPILTGDAYGWSTDTGIAPRLQRLGGSNLYYFETTYQAEARLDYKFVVDNDQWILDPRNPYQTVGGFGPNSEIRMPAFVHPPELSPAAVENQGIIQTFSFNSDIYSNSRTIRVYKPVNYSDAGEPYPVFWFLDGQDFYNLAAVKNVLDNTIASGNCRPVIAVLINFVNRQQEYYDNNAQYRNFLMQELRPYILTTFNVSEDPGENAVGGVSWSAQASLEIATNLPDYFGNVMSLSTAGREPEWYTQPLADVKMYFDWGTYEPQNFFTYMHSYGTFFYNWFYQVWERRFHDGHSWGNWRGHVDDVLAWFFPGDSAVAVAPVPRSGLPSEFQIAGLYPNPANPTATVKYQLPAPDTVHFQVIDLLGNVVLSGSHRALYPENSLHLDLSTQSSGIYFLRLTAGPKSISRKLVLLK